MAAGASRRTVRLSGGAAQGVGGLALAGEQLLPLELVQAAPDAVGLTDPEGVLQAIPADRAGGTNGLGAAFPPLLLVLALELWRWKEHRRMWSTASCFRLPHLVGPLNTHPIPLPGGNLPSASRANKSEFSRAGRP